MIRLQRTIRFLSRIKNEDIYLLEEIDQDTREELNQILQKPFTYLLLFSGDSESGKEIEQQMMENLPEEMRQIPDLTMMDVLEMMPEESRQEMTKEMDQAMEDMPDTLYEQSAVQFIRSEYETLGMDTDQIQLNYIFVSGLKMLGLALVSMVATISVGF